MLENIKVNDIHATRYIASWVRSGGTLGSQGDYRFYKWLLALGISEREAGDILELVRMGKLELEMSAKKFLKGNPESVEDEG